MFLYFHGDLIGIVEFNRDKTIFMQTFRTLYNLFILKSKMTYTYYSVIQGNFGISNLIVQ